MGEHPDYPFDSDDFVNNTNPWLVRAGYYGFTAATGAAGYSSRTVVFVVQD